MWYVLYLQVSALKISLQHFKIYTAPSFDSHSTFIIWVSAHSFLWSWSKLLLGFSIYMWYIFDSDWTTLHCSHLSVLCCFYWWFLCLLSDMFFPSKSYFLGLVAANLQVLKVGIYYHLFVLSNIFWFVFGFLIWICF